MRRIPRTLYSKTLVGISPEYAEKELENDKKNNGGYDFKKWKESGVSPASAWFNMVVAKPAQDVLDLLPQYTGDRCLIPYTLPTCPFTGQCPPAGADAPKDLDDQGRPRPCAWWATGHSSTAQRFIDSGGAKKPSTLRTGPPLDWDIPGRYIGDLWHPYGDEAPPGHDFHFFTPEEVHQCFVGKRIVIQGDSMMRQFYSRLVNYLRQIPTNCENSIQRTTGEYTVFANGSDYFDYICPDRQCPRRDDTLYSIFWDWGDDWDEEGNMARWKGMEPDVVVQATVYWAKPWNKLEGVREVLARFFPDGFKGSWSWYLTPELNNWTVDDYAERNALMRAFFDDLRKKGATNIAVLPTDRLVQVGNGRAIVRPRHPVTTPWADIHFMCGYLGVDYPDPIKAGLQWIKSPTDWDTRDFMNFNLMQIWLNSICEPSS